MFNQSITSLFLNDGTYKVDLVIKAFETEPNGPGKLSRYRAMHKNIRQERGLNVTKDQLYRTRSRRIRGEGMCWWKEIRPFSFLTENQELFLLKFFFRNVPWSVSSYFLFVNSI